MRAIRCSVLLVCSLASLVLIPTVGQQPTRAYQHWPEHKLYASYWTAQRGFTSTLEMKNNRIKDTMVARVSIYFINGEEHSLELVSIAPRQTVVLDLNQILDSLPAARRARLPREGTVEIEYEGPNASALMGSVSVTNPEQGIAWSFFLYPAHRGLSNAPLQGLFWHPTPRADSVVLLHNTSESNMIVHPHVQINGAKHLLSSVTLTAEQVVKLDVRRALKEMDITEATAGGIELTYEGEPDALRAHGLLFDREGFSTQVDFSRVLSLTEPQELSYHTPRFATGIADPVLGLSRRMKFDPYLILHNFGGEQLDGEIFVSYRNKTGPQEMKIPLLVRSGQTRVMELEPYLARSVPRDAHWAGIEIRYKTKQSSLAMTMVSLSEDKGRSIRSVLNWVQSTSREGWYWRADTETNTLVGIQNSADAEGRVVFSLDYYVGQDRRSYEIPLSIPARASHMIDIGEIKRSRLPDADGDIIPPEVSFGGYRAEKLHPRGEGPLTTEALLVNRRRGSFLTVYNTGCCEYAYFFPSSTTGPVGASAHLQTIVEDACTGFTFAANGRYTNYNTNVVTVSSSMASLVGPGSTSISRSIVILKPWSYDPETGQSVCRNGMEVGLPCSVTVKPAVAIGGAHSFAFVGTDPTIPKTLLQALVNPTGGTYSWTANNSRVSFDSPSSDLVAMTGNSPSTALGDTTVSATYTKNGQSSTASRVITVRIFRFLQQAGPVSIIPRSDGYNALVVYNIVTNPGAQIVQPGFSGIRVSEHVQLQSGSLNGVPLTPEQLSQIRQKTSAGATFPNSEIQDDLSLIDTTGQPLPSGLALISQQDLFVGGIFVRTNRIEQRSENIVTITNLGPF